MKWLSGASLRQMLTVPYLALVTLAAVIIGLLSYRAGSEAVDTLSDYVLKETVNRIAQAVDKHVSGSEAVLETAFPTDVPAPKSVKDSLGELRTRFWLATSIHRDPNNYAYYGNRDGQFIGLWRYSESEAELRVRTEPNAPRSIYRYTHINGDLQAPTLEARTYDPRERPWYKAGQSATTQTWTSIYIDFKTLQLVGTRARRVNNVAGEFEGVVATDLSLHHLNDFLRNLQLSPNGFAFIVEPDGNLIATSRGPHLRKGVGEDNTRLNAAASDDLWVASTYKAVKTLTGTDHSKEGSRTSSFAGPDGETLQAGYTRLRDAAGLDWIVAVGVPRSDFMQKISDNFYRTLLMAGLACALIALTGLLIMRRIADNLRQLATAAQNIGDGTLDQSIPVERNDELGDLAKSFAHMRQRLFTDRLTGIANREAAMRRIEDRIVQHRRAGDHRPFTVLFIDLNAFKSINDQFGHDVGDTVLVEIAQRLSANLRSNDLAARIGGDEFVAVLDSVTDEAGAIAARDKLERILAEPLQALRDLASDRKVNGVGAAVGYALCPEHGQDVETLLKRADQAMYQRKQEAKAHSAPT
jgi:diguanylate cyclase (GGDEF)-like protein